MSVGDPINCLCCGTDTNECPDELPVEWKGYCPTCAFNKMMSGDLPKCDGETFKRIILTSLAEAFGSGDALLEIIVEDEKEDRRDVSMTETGQIIYYHPAEDCEDKGPCPMHSPSDHHMKTWPMHGNMSLKLPLIERICPHNAMHPDPDSLAWCLKVDPKFNCYHGACDGCCHTPA
jgi:hypothetical protein